MDFVKEKFFIEEEIRDLCKKVFCEELIEKINVVWSNRMTTTLGKASRIDWTITLSKKAWPLISIDQRIETVSHELAHLVAIYKAGIEAWNHGVVWRSIMGQFGYKSAKQYHNLHVALEPIRRKRTRYLADCDCTVYFLTKKELRHKLTCRVCGSDLRVANSVVKV